MASLGATTTRWRTVATYLGVVAGAAWFALGVANLLLDLGWPRLPPATPENNHREVVIVTLYGLPLLGSIYLFVARWRDWIRRWWKPWLAYTFGLLGFVWALVGFFNVYFQLDGRHIALGGSIGFTLRLPRVVFNQNSEIAVIVLYGVPIMAYLRDRYQKVRMLTLVSLLFVNWYLIPKLWTIRVDWFGHNRPWDSTFPSWDVPGTWTHAGLWILGLLFGRRVHCGWMNTCVAIKETAGAPFRRATKRGRDWGLNWYGLRLFKLVGGVFFMMYPIVLFLPPSPFTQAYFRWFWTMLIVVYFGSSLITPIIGNRAWCRFLCPLMFGWTNMLGFFRVRVDRNHCNDCGACEKVCDFGLPIRTLSKRTPMIRTTECMGCGRCRTACPTGALSLYDVRDFVRERVLHRPPSYLDKLKPRGPGAPAAPGGASP